MIQCTEIDRFFHINKLVLGQIEYCPLPVIDTQVLTLIKIIIRFIQSRIIHTIILRNKMYMVLFHLTKFRFEAI